MMSAVGLDDTSSCFEDDDSCDLSLDDKPNLPIRVPFAVTLVAPVLASLPPVLLYADDETDLPDGQ